MGVFSRNTNYIVAVRSYGRIMKIIVLGYGELKLLLSVFGLIEDARESLAEGTIVYSTEAGLYLAIREYQGGEINLNNFQISPSVYSQRRIMAAV